MFGYREQFQYSECARCGCVQLQQVPDDLARYYPPHYHSRRLEGAKEKALKRFLKRQRARYCLNGTNVLGALVAMTCGRARSHIFGDPDHYTWLRRCKADFSSQILDVGCGMGKLLHCMSRDGFTDLMGVDPYIPDDLCYADRVKIIRGDIYQLDRQFDLIMLHHVFEHMAEPLRALKQLRRLLKPNRYLVIRTPVASSFAYRKYGANWAQLDPPRHLYVHTVKSMELLAQKTQLQISEVAFDSTEFQFLASEQYVRDIPLLDPRSFLINPAASIFSDEERAFYREQAQALNLAHDGDSACFYLFRPSGM
jgi:2-polyprenyl-3-methyl-5-hydroxy-6-metoxy-1,4-benzoquinol methylase